MNNNLKKLVGDRLVELDRTPTEAARIGGLERTFVVDILHGRKMSVRGDNVIRLSRALDLSPGVIHEAQSGGAPLQGVEAASDRLRRGLESPDHDVQKYAIAAFLQELVGEESAVEWLEIVEDLQELSQPLPAEPPDHPDIGRVQMQSRALAVSARRKLQRRIFHKT